MQSRNVDGLVKVEYLDQLNRNADSRIWGAAGRHDLRPSGDIQRELEDPEAGDHRTDVHRLSWDTFQARRLINDVSRY